MFESAAELRAAAQRLRTLAEAATPGPWTLHETSTLYMSGKAAYLLRRDGKPGPIVDLTSHQGDAELIAAMHPGVALALAALLDSYAGVLLEEADAGTNVEVVYREELALARLVLEAK
jgi:hypothetical protein